jgi:hypothetical protein
MNKLNFSTTKPKAITATPVRIQARKVRSFGRMLCEVSNHGGSPEGRISGRLRPLRRIVTIPRDGGDRLFDPDVRARLGRAVSIAELSDGRHPATAAPTRMPSENTATATAIRTGQWNVLNLRSLSAVTECSPPPPAEASTTIVAAVRWAPTFLHLRSRPGHPGAIVIRWPALSTATRYMLKMWSPGSDQRSRLAASDLGGEHEANRLRGFRFCCDPWCGIIVWAYPPRRGRSAKRAESPRYRQ